MLSVLQCDLFVRVSVFLRMTMCPLGNCALSELLVNASSFPNVSRKRAV